MKIETPQILWHNENDSNKNAPLYSVSMLESGFCQDSLTSYGHVLATSGNSSDINLWKVSFTEGEGKRILQTSPNTKIEHMISLTRHERSVNTVAFSPNGLHLATAGDGGSILIWSVPPSKRGNQNGRHFWSSLTKESDLHFRLVGTNSEGINDISWSPDSKRFAVGTIDHHVHIYEDEAYDVNMQHPNAQVESKWSACFRNGSDHSHFVQGVAFDPLNVYLASMGSDRTVRVYARKAAPKLKKKVLRPKDNQDGSPLPPPEHAAMVQELLQTTKFELGKSKTIKSRELEQDESNGAKKTPLFADETTVESFFRRLNWTSDGAFFITPCALWHSQQGETEKENSSPSFATLLFARHRYDAPYKVLPGLEKPSVAVRPSPVLYKLPDTVPMETNENDAPAASLPYRSVFAVLTHDSVLVYDTHHDKPLVIARGLHYAGLTDCTWSVDGRQLVVSSSDGYISILSFDEGEFGQVYTPPKVVAAPKIESTMSETLVQPPIAAVPSPRIPPCEPGQTASIEGRPAKRAKTRITPTLVSAPGVEQATAVAESTAKEEEAKKKDEEENVSSEVQQPKPKKKRIAPTLVSTNPS